MRQQKFTLENLFNCFYFKKNMLIALLVILLLPGLTWAANHYVRSNATGNNSGSDWANAFTSLPSTLIRGDTYYIADGTYGPYVFDDLESGSAYIYIKKATASGHGTETGWDSSYGDGQAVFKPKAAQPDTTPVLTVTTSYWEFDGQVSRDFDHTGYGFKVDCTANDSTPIRVAMRFIKASGGVDYITLKKIAFIGGAEEDLPESTVGWRGTEFRPTSSGVNDHITIDDCLYYHGVVHAFFHNSENVIIKNSHFDDNESNYWNHGVAIRGYYNQDHFDVFNNIFRDIIGTAEIGAFGDDWEVWGNLVYHRYASGGGRNGFFATTSGYAATNVRIYNNTFVDVDAAVGVQCDSAGSTCTVKNNVWINCRSINLSDTSHDYNAADENLGETNDQLISSSIFTNYAGDNFTLSVATDKGDATIGSTYNKDMLGVTRGGDGSWDRGAYEFFSTNNVNNPAPPEGLKLVVTP